MNMNPCVVFITAGSAAEAERIAEALIGERLAACCTIVPNVTSVYRWQGALHHDGELLLVCKSAVHLFPALERRVIALHSYEVPEIIAMPVASVSAPYLAWMTDTLAPEDPGA